MPTIEADVAHLLKRLTELRDWSEYIWHSVNSDQSFEKGKLKLLLELSDARTLQDVRDRARVLELSLSRLIEGIRQKASVIS
jgi:hypothetical protein